MPYVHTVEASLSDVADLLDPPQDRIESPYHVTDLLRASDTSIGVSTYKTPKSGEELVGLMDIGRIWEAVVRSYIDKWAIENGFYLPSWTVPLDAYGLIANLDGILHGPDPSQLQVIEAKARFAQPRDPGTRRVWMGQIMTYCRIIGTYKALMPVLYLPSRPPSAFFQLHHLIFTEMELAMNWNRVQIARSMREAKNRTEAMEKINA